MAKVGSYEELIRGSIHLATEDARDGEMWKSRLLEPSENVGCWKLMYVFFFFSKQIAVMTAEVPKTYSSTLEAFQDIYCLLTFFGFLMFFRSSKIWAT